MTLAKIDIDRFIDRYPNPHAISEFSNDALERYMAELLNISREYGEVNKFPGGVNGFLIFLMLSRTTKISAIESDFADFTYEDLNIYRSAYQELYRAVEERFHDVFKNA
jgi:hypothetical protein